jgi:hypothetical protein
MSAHGNGNSHSAHEAKPTHGHEQQVLPQTIEQRNQARMEAFCNKWLAHDTADKFKHELEHRKITGVALEQELIKLEHELQNEVTQDSILRVQHDLAKEQSGLAKEKFSKSTWGMVKNQVYELSKVFGSVGGKGYSADVERKQHTMLQDEHYRKELAAVIIERKSKLALLDHYSKEQVQFRELMADFKNNKVSSIELQQQGDFTKTAEYVAEQWIKENKTIKLGEQELNVSDPAIKAQLKALAKNELLELAQLSKWQHESEQAPEVAGNWKTKAQKVLLSSTLWSSAASLG